MGVELNLKSDNDSSLTGVPLTALYHAYDSRILISGDQSGMVRIYEIKSESFAPQSSFLSLQEMDESNCSEKAAHKRYWNLQRMYRANFCWSTFMKLNLSHLHLRAVFCPCKVWDVDRKCLSNVHNFEKEITSFAAMQHVPYLYAGDSAGTISVLSLDQEKWCIEQMKYHIPVSESHGLHNNHC